ncbi:MAG: Holliday junction branch migration DNA helicase RuvB [Candidatus Wildermuthbacteria bacterium]|nr:Holliday junction branch migration DNA helicase RuvB [Candidatus Wildermuthbacteria bacterium]
MIVNTPPLEDKDMEVLEKTLRPAVWDDFIGQERVKSTLSVIMEAAKKRKEALEHLLFYGNSGLGKTSLANVVANTMGVGIKKSAGPALERPGDVASLLSNLAEGEVLFIDEIHRANKSVMEMLYSAMEDFALHLILGKGPMARTMELKLPRFTLIGATTKMGLLPAPLRNRFGATFQLGFYEKKNMEDIVRRSAKILQVPIHEEAVGIIAERSRFTPRVANRILKRVRDFASVQGTGTITKETALQALKFLNVDDLGLEPDDRKILEAIILKFSGGPVGIEALSAATSEEEDTVLDIYEPYLLQLGFIERTPKGRTATKKAYEHLGISKEKHNLL